MCGAPNQTKAEFLINFLCHCNSSETSVASQQTTRRHIPEDDTFLFMIVDLYAQQLFFLCIIHATACL
jgi:hypothetical protein